MAARERPSSGAWTFLSATECEGGPALRSYPLFGEGCCCGQECPRSGTGNGFAVGASRHSGCASIRRKNRSAPAMAAKAWLYWLPITWTGSKKKLARKKNIGRAHV